jgi:hypothetical protein
MIGLDWFCNQPQKIQYIHPPKRKSDDASASNLLGKSPLFHFIKHIRLFIAGPNPLTNNTTAQGQSVVWFVHGQNGHFILLWMDGQEKQIP